MKHYHHLMIAFHWLLNKRLVVCSLLKSFRWSKTRTKKLKYSHLLFVSDNLFMAEKNFKENFEFFYSNDLQFSNSLMHIAWDVISIKMFTWTFDICFSCPLHWSISEFFWDLNMGIENHDKQWFLTFVLSDFDYFFLVFLCPLFFIKFSFFHHMIALKKLWRMFFISSKKLFSFSRYSNFCNFFPFSPHFPDTKGQIEVE